jgi:hypothetical protein
LAKIIYEPFVPDGKSCRVYVDENPEVVTAHSEWVYSKQTINQFKLTKPVPSQYQKNAPKHWVDNGWLDEKDVVQLTLF